jgi:hypothetical protein
MRKSKHMPKMVADSCTSIEHTSRDIGMKEYTCGVMYTLTILAILGMKCCKHVMYGNIPWNTKYTHVIPGMPRKASDGTDVTPLFSSTVMSDVLELS